MNGAPAAPPPPASRTWTRQAGDTMAGGIWAETNRGEDAEPLFVHHLPSGQGVTGVFDGSGGSGSASAYESKDGTPRTGAWLAARVARVALETWFGTSFHAGAGFETAALEARLTELLAALRPATPSRIIGRMHKELPTTLAAVRYSVQAGQVDCQVLWAGDSRVYQLSPGGGLQALTRDHTEEEDGLVQLIQDPPLTNVISASAPFFVQEHRRLLDLPCVLVCATDGFFGYVQTPAHFEHLLLATLRDAASMDDWMERLRHDVMGYTTDDASLGVVVLACAGFAELKEMFAARTREVEREYWHTRPRMDAGPPGADDKAGRRWRQKTWDDYRDGYERFMPPVQEER
ncbi:protein phosphatase 2C domain-containing protein [Actinomadura macrotermitis]|uniref:PPM-type phosphatase domain-containing protein n=1 Tax=Actinomadura macrotermitis TaxID=2585200 RepID=A0A7K0BXG0_9ACTN|nr:protein phosphatase 2C domain-containing protein [Actinomadura macrotermitis]MQY05859.1 hypothetical protein [Actinomadura macrotermitis]